MDFFSNMYPVKSATMCRACGSEDIDVILPLRPMPPGDKYVIDPADVPDTMIPADIQICASCRHLQMSGFTDPDYIYETYLSRPATTNPALEEVYRHYADELVQLAQKGYILEVGSNDGLFLDFIQQGGGKGIGIEPAKNLVSIANERNVLTVLGYVSQASVNEAVSLMKERPRVILANHSFSNVENIQDWADTLSTVLADDGYLVLQSFYQLDVLTNNLLENYNHEHLSYLTISHAIRFFGKYGLKLADVKHLASKGGSIRFYFKKTNSVLVLSETAETLVQNEVEFDINVHDMFNVTEAYISLRRNQMADLLCSFSDSDRLAAYGTSIGATVFSYQFGIENYISCFFDDDLLRQGRLSPGTGRPVLPGRSREMNSFKYIVILAPLYADAIISKNLEYLNQGGQFIKFWPNFQIINLQSVTGKNL